LYARAAACHKHPTAEWLAQQIVQAFPWNTAPAYLVRDNDGAYGQAFRRRVRAMGIRDRPISPRSPWQNPYAERLIGTLRRDCLDHVLIFGARHLRRRSYARLSLTILCAPRAKNVTRTGLCPLSNRSLALPGRILKFAGQRLVRKKRLCGAENT